MTTSPLPTAQLSITLIVYHISIAAATRYGRSARGGFLPVIRCLAGARPGAKPRCDIDFAATTRYGRSARGSPEPSTAATRQHDSQLLMKFTACRLRLRVHRGLCYAPQSCWAAVSSRATPRLAPSAIFIALLAGNRSETAALRC